MVLLSKFIQTIDVDSLALNQEKYYSSAATSSPYKGTILSTIPRGSSSRSLYQRFISVNHRL